MTEAVSVELFDEVCEGAGRLLERAEAAEARVRELEASRDDWRMKAEALSRIIQVALNTKKA